MVLTCPKCGGVRTWLRPADKEIICLDCQAVFDQDGQRLDKSYCLECYCQLRSGERVMFDVCASGQSIPKLYRYAIVPLEQYEEAREGVLKMLDDLHAQDEAAAERAPKANYRQSSHDCCETCWHRRLPECPLTDSARPDFICDKFEGREGEGDGGL